MRRLHFFSLISLFSFSFAGAFATPGDVQVKLFESSQTSAAPEINIYIKNTTDRLLNAQVSTKKIYIDEECQIDEARLDGGAPKFRLHERESANYQVQLNPRGGALLYSALDFASRRIKLPCSLEYAVEIAESGEEITGIVKFGSDGKLVDKSEIGEPIVSVLKNVYSRVISVGVALPHNRVPGTIDGKLLDCIAEKRVRL